MGGINKMNETTKNFFERLKSVFKNKKLLRGSRITYGVAWNLILLLMIVMIIGAGFAAGVGAGYFASLVKDEKIRSYKQMKKDIYDYEETSEVYFANQVYLGKLRTDLDREKIAINEIPEHLKHAVIATEDEYFYEHQGIVPKALFRAIFQELTNSSVQSGGSTLTQQLIKNQILTNEVSFDRKAKEVLLALRLEKFFEKDEILEAYLNVSPFGRNSSGQNIAGVLSASKGIFGVEPKDLSIPQAAYIAGLPQSPFGYTPFTNKGTIKENLEPGLKRMKTVLFRMHEEGYITTKEYEDALHYNIVNDFTEPLPSTIEKYPYLTFEVENRAIKLLAKILAEKDGLTENDLNENESLKDKYFTLADRDLRQNGYRIHTTIDKDIYDKMQEVKNQYDGYGPTFTKIVKNDEGIDEEVPEPVQIGAVLIENKTGKMISFVGGRDFNIAQTNHATRSKRPTGSTMKPLLVYAPAMEMGKLAPGSIIADTETGIRSDSGKPWPQNYVAGRYYGLVTAREALAKSHNVSAVKVYKDIIGQRPAAYLEKMGFSSLVEEDYQNYSTALGSLKYGATVEENVNAFTTFANEGKFIDSYMIDRIEDHQGNIIYEHKVESADVFSPQTAFLTIDMMREVFRTGTASSVPNMLKFSTDWAGKTGTSNDYKDSWLVASNPNVTFGTWIGYDQPKSLYSKAYGDYNVRNYKIWSMLINGAYDVNPELINPKENFKMPGGIVKRSFCAISGKLPSEACARAGLVQTDYFNANFVPSEVDDSLIVSRYVTIHGNKYLALDSTPAEFSESGLMLNPDSINTIAGTSLQDIKQLIPEHSKLSSILVPYAKISDNGVAPATVNASLNASTISWTPSSSNDVIGYRIYTHSGQKVDSVKADSGLTRSVGNGSYYVVAVDIAGRESAPSNIVKTGDIETDNNQEEGNEQTEEQNEEPLNKEDAIENETPPTPEPEKERSQDSITESASGRKKY